MNVENINLSRILYQVEKKEKKDEIIIGIVWLLSIFLPHQGFLYLFNPIILLFLAYRYSNLKHISIAQWLIAGVILISMFYAIIFNYTTFKSIARAVTLIEVFLFFPFINNVKIRNSFIYFAILYILLSQLIYLLNVNFLTNFFNYLYPYSGDEFYYQSDYLVENLGKLNISQGISSRYGGLFYNPNQCMKYVSLIVAVYMLENWGKSVKKHFIFYGLVLFSTLLAGSRTGFIIVLLYLLIQLFFSLPKKKTYYILGTIFLLIILLNFTTPIENIMSKFRVLDITGSYGNEGSLSLKWSNFRYYLDSMNNVFQVLFGNFEIDLFQTYYQSASSMFDSEWGNLIFIYGFVFLILIIYFFFKIIRKNRYPYYFVFILLIWALSSTVLFSFRTSFAFMLIFSKYSNHKSKNVSALISKKLNN